MKKTNKKVVESLVVSTEQLTSYVKKQIKHLKLVNPDAAIEDGYKDGTMELRFLRRTDEGTKTEWSYNTWVLNEESEKYLFEKMSKMNGLPCCTYYSAYTFTRLTKDEKKVNQITNDVSLHTSVLPMDFDEISESEFLSYKQIFTDLGFETLDVFSGHGYQSLILLDEKNYNKNLFGDFTDLLLRKGFPVDSKIRDSARILRLPYTFNCKEFLPTDKHYNPDNPKGIPTYVYNETRQRYDVKSVFEKIESLPDVPKKKTVRNPLDMTVEEFLTQFGEDEIEEKVETVKLTRPAKPVESIKTIKSNENVKSVKTQKTKNVLVTSGQKEENDMEIKSKEEYEKLYEHIEFMKLPEAVQSILMGVKQGIGNDSLLFLVPMLKNRFKLSLDKQIETMKVWGSHCSPVWSEEEIEKEVKRLNKDYPKMQAMHGKYTDELFEQFGELVWVKWKDEDEIILENEVFEKIKYIGDGPFQLYLSLKLLVHEEGRNNFTNDDICERVGVSLRTFERGILPLTKQGLVTKKRMSRTNGLKYEYYLNPYHSETKGYTVIKASLIDLLFAKKISKGAFSLYLYLKYMVGNSKKECWSSQIYLAKELGKTSQTTISKLTDELHNQKFIRKEVIVNGIKKNCTYLLLK